jgi:hypothetical protein
MGQTKLLSMSYNVDKRGVIAFGRISVAVLDLTEPLKVGETIHIKGHTGIPFEYAW